MSKNRGFFWRALSVLVFILAIGVFSYPSVQAQTSTPSATPANPTATTVPGVCGNGTIEGAEQCDDGNTSDRDACLANCTNNPQCRLVNFDSGTINQIATANDFWLTGPGSPASVPGIINIGTTTIFQNPTTGGPASVPNGLCNALNTIPRCTSEFTMYFRRRPYFVSFYFLSGAGAGNLGTSTIPTVGSGVIAWYNDVNDKTPFLANPAQHFYKHNLAYENISRLDFYLTNSAEMIDDMVICQEPVGCGDDILEGTEACDDGNNANGDGCSATCEVEQCAAPYDLLILIDSTNSVKEYGLADEVNTAADRIIDTFDFSRNRLSIGAHAGWSMYNNTGFTSDKTVLKARVDQFTSQNFNLCFPGNPCFGNFDDAIRNFFNSNKRTVNNMSVPQYVVLFNDGDIYQIPSDIPNNGYNSTPYSYRGETGHGGLSPYISQWRSFLNEFPVFWIRFTDGYTMFSPNYTNPNNTVKDSSYRRDIALQDLVNNPNKLYDAFRDTFDQACEVITPLICGDGIIKSPEEQCDDGNVVNGDGCSSTCQTTTVCNDGEDNDGDNRIDCDPISPDLGCFPNGLGGGGACNPQDNDEQDAINACTGECVEDRHCAAGNVCVGETCMANQCTISGMNCDADRCLAICPSVTLSNETPIHGETVQFTCTAVPGTERYVFHIKAPESGQLTILEGENGSNVSPSYTIEEYGDYKLQCTLCTGATDDTCLALEEM